MQKSPLVSNTTLPLYLGRVLDWVTMVQVSENEIAALPTNRLGAGEEAAIAYALTHNRPMVGLDDQKARQLDAELYNAALQLAKE